jgi:3-dehydroquinate synthase
VTAILTLRMPGVPSSVQSHTVAVGPGVVDDLPAALHAAAPRAQRVAVLTDENVFACHGQTIVAAVRSAGLDAVVHVMRAGEAEKHAGTLLECIGSWAKGSVDRSDVALVLGGGVVGDLGGLAAHLYMRGIPRVVCPTSLLAMVDASVGGKVAIDAASAKNLVGAFSSPQAVLVDTAWLATLPAVQWSQGAAEMLKHGLLFSPEHFDALVGTGGGLASLAPDALGELVATSVSLKAACVAADPTERKPGGRELLNLGHTFGHAIEQASGYTLGHGEAVALGLVAAARVSRHRGVAEHDLEPTITSALAMFGLPTDLDPWLAPDRIDAVTRALGRDKKRAGGTLTYIALIDVGRPHPLSLTIDELVAAVGAST